MYIIYCLSGEERYAGLTDRDFISVFLSTLMVSKYFYISYMVDSLEECAAICTLQLVPYDCNMFAFENGTQSYCSLGNEACDTGELNATLGNWPEIHVQKGWQDIFIYKQSELGSANKDL